MSARYFLIRNNAAELTFMPTYKLDVDTDVYDSSELQRVPAYTDRVLWKTDPNIQCLKYDRYNSDFQYGLFDAERYVLSAESLYCFFFLLMSRACVCLCQVVSLPRPFSITSLRLSDHRPVYAVFSVTVAGKVETKQRVLKSKICSVQ